MEGKWTRWQDWTAFLAGVVTAVTPLWFTPETMGGTVAMIVLGALLAVGGLWSLMMPEALMSEWAHIALGVLIVVAPWALSYQDQAGAAWTSWIAGIVAVVAGLWVALPTRRARGAHA